MSVTLSKKERDTYSLRAGQGMSFQAIGEKLQVKASSARVYYCKARKKLGIQEETKSEKQQLTELPMTPLPTNVEEMAAVCEEKAARILVSMGNVSIKGATLSQKSRAISDLIVNSRLLRGEATQIITHEDRRKLKDLIPAILLEAKRRGMLEELNIKEIFPDIVTES